MSELSPAAQAVKDAFDSKWAGTRHQALIAALRAAADQVVPQALCVHNDDFVYVRHQLRALADELEG